MGKKLLIIGVILVVLIGVLVLLKGCKNNKDITVNFSISPTDTAYVGSDVTCTSTTQGAKSWDWDFGDGEKGSNETETHHYEKAGPYKITLTVNGKSVGNPKIIYIKEKFHDPVSITPIEGHIDGPKETEEGKSETFTDKTPNAKGQIWSFGDGTPSVKDQVTVTHSFKESGVHTITLTNSVSEGTLQATLQINVKKKHVQGAGTQPGSGDPCKMIPTLTDPVLMSKLQAVASNAAQFSPVQTELKKYVESMTIPVVVNNGGSVPLLDYLNRIMMEKTKIKGLKKEMGKDCYITKISITE